MKRGTPTGRHLRFRIVLGEIFHALVEGLQGPGKERHVHVLVGALHALPFGLGDVAVEARIPGAVAAEIGTAIGQVRRRSRGGLGLSVLFGAEAGKKRPGIFGQLLAIRLLRIAEATSASHAAPAIKNALTA